jgi:transposase
MDTDRGETEEIKADELQEILEQVKASLGEAAYDKLDKLMQAYLTVQRLLQSKHVTVERLRRIIFGPKSEKTDVVFKNRQKLYETDKPKGKRPGHGRNGAAAYRGAEKIKVPHPSMQPKDVCPECGKGKVYPHTPGSLVRITGQAPLEATVYELDKLRCNACGKTFEAPLPAGVEYTKYDATAAAMIGVLKYGVGLPFNRLENLEGELGIPLPASTQWEIVKEAAETLKPAHQELIKEAAQGKVLHNDDTSMKILELAKARDEAEPDKHERTGCFTTGIVSVREDHTIALFFTGAKHAGENLEDVLKQRADGLKPPIQMCDALSRNSSEEFNTILANCVAHARRRFVEAADNFPEECEYLLGILKDVYKNDAAAKKQRLSDDERLAFHQANSKKPMEDLNKWAEDLLAKKKVEPNSGLGQALTYLLKHWEKLTLFLKVPGAPLDNNVAERSLKKAILHRKNSLFFKTAAGAEVGDMFMSLIHSTELAGGNAFDYLTTLLRHPKQLAQSPAAWMPWNYMQTLAALEDSTREERPPP